MFLLPPALRHHCHASLRGLLIGARDAVDSADVLVIGAWFGALSTPAPGISPAQRRHLLMLLLTLRHVAPVWDDQVPHTTDTLSAVHVLQHLAGHVIHPLPHEAIGAAIDTAVAWAEWQEQYVAPNARNVASFPVSLYTATKAIEGCLYADQIAGYPAETHAAVAICLAAAAFADGW